MKTLLKHNFLFILKNTLVIYFIFLVLGFTLRAVFPSLEEELFIYLHLAAMLCSYLRFQDIAPKSYEKWSSLIPLNNDQLNKLYNLTSLLFSLTLLLIYLPSCWLYESTGMIMEVSVYSILVSIYLFHASFMMRNNNTSSARPYNILNLFKLKRTYFYFFAIILYSYAFIELMSYLVLLVLVTSLLLVEHLIRHTYHLRLKVFSVNNLIPIGNFVLCTSLMINVIIFSKKTILESPNARSMQDLFKFTGVTPLLFSDEDMVNILESQIGETGFAYFYILFNHKYPQEESRNPANHSSKRLNHSLSLDFYKTIKSKKEFIPFLYTLNFFTQAEMDQEKVDYYILRSKKFDLIEQQMALRYLKNFAPETSKDKIDNMLTSFQNNCHKIEKLERGTYQKIIPQELYSYDYCSF